MLIENGTTPTLVFLLTDPDDNETAVTGKAGTVTVEISKNGGAFATVTNSASEIGNGWYSVALTSTESNTDGPLILRAVVTGSPSNLSNEYRWQYQVYTSLAADLAAAVMNQIADHVLRRNLTTVTASGDGDTIQQHALINAARKLANRTRNNSGSLEVYAEDGVTIAYSQTVTTNAAAQPVTEIN